MIYDAHGNVICDCGEGGTSYTDNECTAAFMAEVNKKAASIGMTNSSFVKPAGDSNVQQTTAEDMALLTLIASSYRRLAEVWSKDSYTVVPRNRTATITVNTTVHDATLEALYPILGGKTGSGYGGRALACLCDVNGRQVAGYIAGTSSDADRFAAMKELMDICATILGGGTNTNTVTKATSAVALEVPTYFTATYEQQTPNTLYTQAGSTSIIPASTAKMITAITMLDWTPDITKTFKFVEGDMAAGAEFQTGDEISFLDGLYALMLPSSNTTANAFARVIGRKILNS